MADSPDDGAPVGETPMQKALRLKKASQAAKGPPMRGGKLTDERRAAARSSSQSKPWMKK